MNITAVCIGPDDDMEQRRVAILDSVARAEEGNGVVLLTDMFGGTPSNLAISIMDKANVEVIAGVNLPMLIKLASVRQTESLEEAAQSAQEAGRKYINIASRLLTQEGRELGMVDYSRDGDILRCTAVIANRRGLHARAAAKFVKLAAGFDAEITVSKRGTTVSGRSILGSDDARRWTGHRNRNRRRRTRGGRSHRGSRKIIEARFEED